MLRRVMSRVFFIQTSLYLYSCTKRHVFNTNELEESLPSVVVSLLEEYKDMFSNNVPSGLPLIRGIGRQIDFVPSVTIPTNQPIGVIQRRQRNFKGKLRSC